MTGHEINHGLDFGFWASLGKPFNRPESERSSYQSSHNIRLDLMKLPKYKDQDLLGPKFWQSLKSEFQPNGFKTLYVGDKGLIRR